MASAAPDSSALFARKQAVRQRIRAFLETVTPAQREAWSATAAGLLLGRIASIVPTGSVVAVYASQRLEVDTGPLLADGRYRWAFPSIDGNDLVFRQCAPSELVVAGALREPPKDAPSVEPALFVVPGRAFDRAGRRLGRGKGYYDRALRPRPDIRAIGLCFGGQLLDEVPAGPDDVAVHEVVTENGVIRCDPGRRGDAGD